jgi:hypothetical protein
MFRESNSSEGNFCLASFSDLADPIKIFSGDVKFQQVFFHEDDTISDDEKIIRLLNKNKIFFFRRKFENKFFIYVNRVDLHKVSHLARAADFVFLV